MSYENAGDMYTAVDMSKKKKNDYTSPVAESYEIENNESIPMQSMTSQHKSVPPKPPPFESTCNTLSCIHSSSNRADSPTSKSKGAIKETPLKFKLVVIIIAVVMVAAMVLCLIISFVAIAGNSTLKQQLSDSNIMLQQLDESNTMLQQQLTTLHNQTQQLNKSNTMLQQQLTTLHNQTQQLNDSNTMLQQQLINQTQQLSNFNTMLQQQLTTVGSFPFYPACSCAALPPSSPSGYYWVRASNGSAVSVYCNMTLSCGGVTGGWMRVARLDMTNSSHQCPSRLMERNDSPNIRTCVRNEISAGCSSVELSTANIQYSTVCGRIKAYQVGRPNQFRSEMEVIGSHYVDGVSFTHGSPRQHIWTFAAARDEDQTCNCNGTEGDAPPAFVGQDYFCEAGSLKEENTTVGILLPDDPLWDGAGCSKAVNTCCSFNNPPWFYKQLPSSATDNIEMRVCRNAGNESEDVAIENVEVYIQ